MLQLDQLKVSLETEAGLVRAIDGIALALKRGETFALVGESGCGKSMTALALMRLLPQGGRVTAGRLQLDGVDVFGLPEAQMRAVRGGRIGLIFQEPATSLNPVMRVGDQIVEAIETHTALRGAAARERAIEWLARVGIPEPARRVDDYPFQMSGGQKQRVMIAMTLAGEPDYLIADEPTTALDVTVQAQILALLKDLQRERGLGILLITHDLGVVAGMAHQVALMYAGQIVETAAAADFFAAPLHPYARMLLQALPSAAKRDAPLAAIAGSVPPLSTEFQGCRFAARCDRVMLQCTVLAPELMTPAQRPANHQVRCLLYSQPSQPSQPTQPASNAFAPNVAADLKSAQAPVESPLGAAPLLEVNGLSVHYPLRRKLFSKAAPAVFKAVDGVSFSLAAGRTLALVGESGCGKSSIGKAVLQLLRGKALLQGQVLLDGQDLAAMQGAQLLQARRSIQIIFQDPFASLNPRMRVQDLLEEGLLALRPDLDARARMSRMGHLLEQVGLGTAALQRLPHEFSGGQRQRIAIARALAVEPRLIVCDEPTSALDVSVQAQILNLLKALQREQGLAYLFITHNIGVVEYLADDVAVMQGGRIVEAGPSETVLRSPEESYTPGLLQAVPRVPHSGT
ncbi:ABC transporter ATP-binding protein [Paucibacter sp. Y2R2-4]|uniref:ABC transporter ATP-binding protein n=1 Tax=Paucibacter sp. Y2R2-4 TaxID=2893553 RepID=UPI0021E3AA06|nr:ABC transporter ATP-binding protein [Paucibacter sp. Y2R2-4]MCV2348898.1 ABC transporter ATP-binding protein [Paucibacter sp. Y2R2-4]